MRRFRWGNCACSDAFLWGAAGNPYWLARGQVNSAGDDILWSEPEIALYGRGWDDAHNDPAYDLA